MARPLTGWPGLILLEPLGVFWQGFRAAPGSPLEGRKLRLSCCEEAVPGTATHAANAGTQLDAHGGHMALCCRAFTAGLLLHCHSHPPLVCPLPGSRRARWSVLECR